MKTLRILGWLSILGLWLYVLGVLLRNDMWSTLVLYVGVSLVTLLVGWMVDLHLHLRRQAEEVEEEPTSIPPINEWDGQHEGWDDHQLAELHEWQEVPPWVDPHEACLQCRTTPALESSIFCHACLATPAPFDNSDVDEIDKQFWSLVSDLRCLSEAI